MTHKGEKSTYLIEPLDPVQSGYIGKRVSITFYDPDESISNYLNKVDTDWYV